MGPRHYGWSTTGGARSSSGLNQGGHQWRRPVSVWLDVTLDRLIGARARRRPPPLAVDRAGFER